MAKFFLANNVRVGTTQLFAGSEIDDSVDDVPEIEEAGGVLFAQGTAEVDAAAAKAQAVRLRGGNPDTMEGLMNAAIDGVQQTEISAAVPLATVQTGAASLVGGTVTIASANITANSRIIPIRDVEAGVAGNLSIGTVVVGEPGSFDINSANGADTSSIHWLVIG